MIRIADTRAVPNNTPFKRYGRFDNRSAFKPVDLCQTVVKNTTECLFLKPYTRVSFEQLSHYHYTQHARTGFMISCR